MSRLAMPARNAAFVESPRANAGNMIPKMRSEKRSTQESMDLVYASGKGRGQACFHAARNLNLQKPKRFINEFVSKQTPLTWPSATLSPSDGEREGVRGCVSCLPTDELFSMSATAWVLILIAFLF